MPSKKSDLRDRRRELRNNATPAEAKLWTYLRNRELEDRKFRRQHSIGRFIVDFYCPEERLAVELDGQVHEGVVAENLDYERTQFLEGEGVRVIRFENRIVFEHPEWVLEQIRNCFGDRRE